LVDPFPSNNLDPGSQQWARRIESEIRQITQSIVSNASRQDNSAKGMTGTLSKLAEQQAALEEQQAALAAQQAALSSQQGLLAATVSDLASRVSVTTSITSFNSGSILNDGVDRVVGADMNITVSVPTGKLLVMVGCGEASLNVGTAGAVQGFCTFSIPGVVSALTHQGRNYFAPTTIDPNADRVGTPLILVRSISVPPGTYTVTGKMGTWAAGGTMSVAPNIQFNQPFMTVQVTS
jgi:hypothetical protein